VFLVLLVVLIVARLKLPTTNEVEETDLRGSMWAIFGKVGEPFANSFANMRCLHLLSTATPESHATHE
jgi:hypothetical protein